MTDYKNGVPVEITKRQIIIDLLSIIFLFGFLIIALGLAGHADFVSCGKGLC